MPMKTLCYDLTKIDSSFHRESPAKNNRSRSPWPLCGKQVGCSDQHGRYSEHWLLERLSDIISVSFVP